MLKIRLSLCVLLAAASLTCGVPVHAADTSSAAIAAHVERVAVEDAILDYYALLGSGNHAYGKFFVEDGVLEVNGAEFRGAQAIEDIYKRIGAAGTAGKRNGKRMVISNLQVKVNGETATARMYWTELVAETVTAAPRVAEYGIETAELVKRDGRWLYKTRTVTSDGGMSANQLKTWKRR